MLDGSKTSHVKRAAWVVLALAIVGVSLWVAFTAEPKIVTDLTNATALTLAFAGLVVLTHYLGLLSLGQGALVGVGAYAALHAVNDLGAPVLWMQIGRAHV